MATSRALIGPLGKFTWRMLATVLVGQSILIAFGALLARSYAVAGGDEAAAGQRLWGGLALAVLALLAAGFMRRRAGLALGWMVQALTWLSALVAPAMIGVGVIFSGLWVFCLIKGLQVDAAHAGVEARLSE